MYQAEISGYWRKCTPIDLRWSIVISRILNCHVNNNWYFIDPLGKILCGQAVPLRQQGFRVLVSCPVTLKCSLPGLGIEPLIFMTALLTKPSCYTSKVKQLAQTFNWSLWWHFQCQLWFKLRMNKKQTFHLVVTTEELQQLLKHIFPMMNTSYKPQVKFNSLTFIHYRLM